jgi:tagatose-1,6-bisphosphate aldolase
LAATLQFGVHSTKNAHPKKPKTYVIPPLVKEGETNKGWSMATVIRKKGGKAEKVIYYHTDESDTKYSKSDAGSSVSDGWTKEGKLLFIQWVKTVRAARNHRGTRAMENLIWRAL